MSPFVFDDDLLKISSWFVFIFLYSAFILSFNLVDLTPIMSDLFFSSVSFRFDFLVMKPVTASCVVLFAVLVEILLVLKDLWFVIIFLVTRFDITICSLNPNTRVWLNMLGNEQWVWNNSNMGRTQWEVTSHLRSSKVALDLCDGFLFPLYSFIIYIYGILVSWVHQLLSV